jgi:HEAT repeat protein
MKLTWPLAIVAIILAFGGPRSVVAAVGNPATDATERVPPQTSAAAEEDLSKLVPVFDSQQPEAQVKIIERAALDLSPDRDVLLVKALASKDKTVRDAALKVLERTGEPRSLLEAVAAGTGPKAERDRAHAALDRWAKPPALPDMRKVLADILPSRPAVTPSGAPSLDDLTLGFMLTVHADQPLIQGQSNLIRYDLDETVNQSFWPRDVLERMGVIAKPTPPARQWTLHVLSLSSAHEGSWQYVLRRNGAEAERGDPKWSALCFFVLLARSPGESDAILLGPGQATVIAPGVPPGKYELTLESRFLATDLSGPLPPTSTEAPRLTVGHVVSLVSDPVRVEIVPPASGTSGVLAPLHAPDRISDRPTDARDEIPKLAQWLRQYDGMDFRDFSIAWGGRHTALALGRIGDPVAVPVLRWATGHTNILARWYAAAALKMIEMKGMNEKDRKAAVAEWLRHCFSSPEEHYIAREYILDYLDDCLGPDSKPLYQDLAKTVTDPWMKFDCAQAIEKVDNAEAIRVLSAAATGADPKTRTDALRGLVDRRAAEAGPLMIAALLDSDESVRAEAIRGLELAGPDSSAAPLAIHLATGNFEWQERAAAEKALAAVCLRAKDKDALVELLASAMSEATGQTRVSLVRVLGRLGGKRAARALFDAVNVTNPDAREAAVRALSAWPDDSAVDALLDIAWHNPETVHQPLPADARGLTIRGLARLASSPDMPDTRRLEVLRKSWKCAVEAEEKKAVLGALGNLSTAGSLTYVTELIDNTGDDGESVEAAAAAAVRIARAAKDIPPATLRAAMEKVLARSQADATRKAAQAIMAKLPK